MAVRIVGRGQDHAVAVGVLEVGVSPIPGREVTVVHLPDAHDHGHRFAVDLVAVDGEGVERVVGPRRLQLRVGGGGLRRVPQLDVAEGGRVGDDLEGVRDWLALNDACVTSLMPTAARVAAMLRVI